jgi:hypothetical protein
VKQLALQQRVAARLPQVSQGPRLPPSPRQAVVVVVRRRRSQAVAKPVLPRPQAAPVT